MLRGGQPGHLRALMAAWPYLHGEDYARVEKLLPEFEVWNGERAKIEASNAAALERRVADLEAVAGGALSLQRAMRRIAEGK